jgi:hypothetical protein
VKDVRPRGHLRRHNGRAEVRRDLMQTLLRRLTGWKRLSDMGIGATTFMGTPDLGRSFASVKLRRQRRSFDNPLLTTSRNSRYTAGFCERFNRIEIYRC